MTGLLSLGNVSGFAALVVLATGVFWAMAVKNQPVVSVASMLRNQDKDR